MSAFNTGIAKKFSIATTVADAALAFARGRHRRGALLLGAAALSVRFPGLGTAVSVLSRLLDRRGRDRQRRARLAA